MVMIESGNDSNGNGRSGNDSNSTGSNGNGSNCNGRNGENNADTICLKSSEDNNNKKLNWKTKTNMV